MKGVSVCFVCSFELNWEAVLFVIVIYHGLAGSLLKKSVLELVSIESSQPLFDMKSSIVENPSKYSPRARYGT